MKITSIISALAGLAGAEQLFLQEAPQNSTLPLGVAEPVESLLQAAPVAGNKKLIVGYFTAWSIYGRHYFPSDIPVDKVDVINYAFANIDGGKVVLGDAYADTDKKYPGDCWEAGCKRGNFNQLNKLKNATEGLKTMISVGGWTWSSLFSDIALTEASREIFAQSAVEFVAKWGFDGVDLDWEYPVEGGLGGNHHNPADKENYTLLLKKLRELLSAEGLKTNQTYYLSLAASANINMYKNYEWTNIA